MNTSVGKTLLEMAVGDIALLDVDAIANAANNELWMGAGVAGAIKRAGGQEIEQEAMRQGPIAVGDAVSTGAGTLAAKWVIHAAVMGHDLRTDANLIAQATSSTLEVADQLSAALPGAAGVRHRGRRLSDLRLRQHHGRRRCAPTSPGPARSGLRKVVFCAYDDVGAAAFKNALSGLTRFEA